MSFKNLKISYLWQGKKQVPKINISGEWLKNAGFEILYIIFESKILSVFLRGSVIPFLSLEEYKRIISPILKNAIHENRIINEHYLQIRKIEENIQKQDKIKKLLFELKKTLSNEVRKQLSIELI